MKPLPRRIPSKSAKWSLRVAGFAPILGIMSILAHRTGTVSTPSFLVLLMVVGVIAVFALVLVLLALHSLWTRGTRGGRRASWALLFVAIVLSPFIYASVLWLSLPSVIQVSTDLIDPPTTRQEISEFGDKAPIMVATVLVDAYPQITGRRYNPTPEIIYDQILKLADKHGWSMVSSRGTIGVDDDLFAEFKETSRFLAMPRSILIRVRDEDDKTIVDMRARAEFVSHDLGINADLIGRFLSELDFVLIGHSD